jgi:diadenosine tetraphosphate (Ap4A) HIT family hydrolase
MFSLHPRLQQDCRDLGRLELCRLLLMNDRNYPWFILVPERENVTEIYQLTESDQVLLLRESALLARTMARLFSPDKLNIGSIGNLVPQLHVHHLARKVGDPAWPGTVWGRPPGEGYTPEEVDAMRATMTAELALQ